MKKKVVEAAAFAALVSMIAAGCGAKSKDELDPKHPVEITIWNYYSGEQLNGFNALVDQFNAGKGKEIGVVVKSVSQGSLSDLENALQAAVEKKVGSEEVPNMYPSYTDSAYEMDKQGLIADISSYFTKEELAEYVPGYIAEGAFAGEGTLKIMPVAKSTEIFVLNETDWKPFADATGAEKADLATMEGVVKTAEAYYNWTDSQTEEPNDGKAFFGRDAMANYMLIGAKQLGAEIIGKDKDGKAVIDFDEKVVRTLWDNFYVPYIKGYFSSTGRFRSDDLKTGNIIAYVGSASSATFTPDTVTLEDNSTYSIETGVYAAPEFAEGEQVAVQQGAGMVVTEASKREIAGSVEFLKWFTDTDQNIQFAVSSGYLPVKTKANDAALLAEADVNQAEIVKETLKVAVETVANNTMYTTMPVEHGSEIRDVLEASLLDQAVADRAAVETLMADGTSYEDAISQYLTDETFENWYQKTKESIEF